MAETWNSPLTETKDTPSPTEMFLLVFCTFAFFPLSVFFWAVVFCQVWGWFAPIVSSALPILTLKQSVAARCLLALCTAHITIGQIEPKKKAKDKFTALFIGTFAAPWIVLLFGWLIHLFVYAIPVEAVRP